MPRYHNINGEIVQFTAEEEVLLETLKNRRGQMGALGRAQARLRQREK